MLRDTMLPLKTRLMSQPLPFDDIVNSLPPETLREVPRGRSRIAGDVAERVFESLASPVDFPPLKLAIVPGDRVAIAADPNVPQLREVLRGVVRAVKETEAARIDLVLWDEATDATLETLRAEFGDGVQVSRHETEDRECLRYLSADAAADPIYLNRRLVDADFMLPLVAVKSNDTSQQHDLTGIFPSLADSATRARCRDSGFDAEATLRERPESFAWLIGVQLLVAVLANAEGNVGEIVAGSLAAVDEHTKPTTEQSEASPLVIASIDGDEQQQSWANAARAAAAASQYAEPDATIVLWTRIRQVPSGKLIAVGEDAESGPPSEPLAIDGEFPDWNPTAGPALSLAKTIAEHRVLLHSEVDDDLIESMGLGVVSSAQELQRLCASYPAYTVVRAAQFA